MNIKELCIKENKKFRDYNNGNYYNYYNFCDKNLTSLEGLPEDFNSEIYLNHNNLKNLKGLPKNFNSILSLYNKIETLDGLNDVLDPRKIRGLSWNFVVSEYIRLGKAHLLV